MNAKKSLHTILVLSASMIAGCRLADSPPATAKTDTLSEAQTHMSENALKGLVVADGLQVQKMASEPAIKNPTNMDVDDRGRIFVTEAYNYRPDVNGNPTNPAGDRIMILEDKDGDGVAETSKVFYQGPEINAPLGVCVLGDRVIVSQSPYVWVFHDDNGDDKADRKEVLFQGISGIQHDHGMHAFIGGPDGKLYFNFGNEGKTLRDKNNKPVLDQDGDSISPKKYRMGMVFRCDPDGSHVECLGSNFRNNYEVAVDSYGTMWQSDNDDDGNRGVRINYVMPYGNYGYTDEMTGAGWRSPRTNMEDSIPLRHWHLNDPGVVPNLLQTGAGSPTGMVVYEGSLLPEKYRNQMIHCDAGRNVVRAYPVTKAGAGYTATIDNILTGEHDQWFRPADLCVAPDGSLLVADWYDPGVGGHAAGDQQKGRVYRVAPSTASYKVPVFDYKTPQGAIVALQNPNKDAQYKAWYALHDMGTAAVPALEQLWNSNAPSRMKARAFWVLVKMPGGVKYIPAAIASSDPDLRIVGLRAACELQANKIDVIAKLVDDKDPQVRRECAIALHHDRSPQAAALWAKLALSYDGRDRWYLEALGIGADRQWDAFYDAYIAQVKEPLKSAAARDIVWRSRTDKSLPLLQALASDESVDWKARQRYFRAFDFHTGPAKSKALLAMMANNKSENAELNTLLLHHLDPKEIKRSPVAQKALADVLSKTYGTPAYIDLVRQYMVKTESDRVLQLALSKPKDDIGIDASQLYLQLGNAPKVRAMLKDKDTARALGLLESLGRSGSGEGGELIKETILSSAYPESIRMAAAKSLVTSWFGNERALALLQTGGMPDKYKLALGDAIKHGLRPDLYRKAEPFLPGAPKPAESSKALTAADVLSLTGDANNGHRVFKQLCTICHNARGEGNDFGPKLSEIGDKLPREALFEAITNPSKGVAFGYETTELTMKDGSKMQGIVSSKTETELDLKLPGGSVQKLRRSDVQSMKTLPMSMMPDLHESMSRQELADLIQYLSTLKRG